MNNKRFRRYSDTLNVLRQAFMNTQKICNLAVKKNDNVGILKNFFEIFRPEFVDFKWVIL